MAKQEAGYEIEKTIEDRIFYKWKGVYCVRNKGNTGKQAAVAKIQAGYLGQASALSARIRKALGPVLPVTGNRKIMYRLNNALQQWLRSEPNEPTSYIPSLTRFSFHGTDENKTFDVAMHVSRTAGGLLLHIPPFDSPNPIYPLPFNGKIDLHLMAVSCNIHDKDDTLVNETQLNIAYDGTPLSGRELFLSIRHGENRLTLLVMSVNKTEVGVLGSWWG